MWRRELGEERYNYVRAVVNEACGKRNHIDFPEIPVPQMPLPNGSWKEVFKWNTTEGKEDVPYQTSNSDRDTDSPISLTTDAIYSDEESNLELSGGNVINFQEYARYDPDGAEYAGKCLVAAAIATEELVRSALLFEMPANITDELRAELENLKLELVQEILYDDRAGREWLANSDLDDSTDTTIEIERLPTMCALAVTDVWESLKILREIDQIDPKAQSIWSTIENLAIQCGNERTDFGDKLISLILVNALSDIMYPQRESGLSTTALVWLAQHFPLQGESELHAFRASTSDDLVEKLVILFPNAAASRRLMRKHLDEKRKTWSVKFGNGSSSPDFLL